MAETIYALIVEGVSASDGPVVEVAWGIGHARRLAEQLAREHRDCNVTLCQPVETYICETPPAPPVVKRKVK